MMIKAAKRKEEGGRWMRWEGRYLGFGHARAVRESDFHTIASEAQYFSAPLGKVWFSQGQLGYLQIRIIKNITVFLVPASMLLSLGRTHSIRGDVGPFRIGQC